MLQKFDGIRDKSPDVEVIEQMSMAIALSHISDGYYVEYQ